MGDMPESAAIPTRDWSLWRTVLRMHHDLDRVLEQQLQRETGLSMADFSVLQALRDADGHRLRARELGDALSWEKSRISHQVSRMEGRTLVEKRLCDSDGRGVWVSLTDDGRAAVDTASEVYTAALDRFFFATLGENDLEQLGLIAQRVTEALDAPSCSQLEQEQTA